MSHYIQELEQLYNAIPPEVLGEVPTEALINSLESCTPSYPPQYHRKLVFAMCRQYETPDQVALWADPEYTADQAVQVHDGYMNALTPEQIDLYRSPNYTPHQMHILKQGLERKLSNEQVSICTSPEFTPAQMRVILRSMLRYKLSITQAQVLADPRYSPESMQQMTFTLSQGATADEARKHAFPKLSPTEASRLMKDSEALSQTIKEFDPSPITRSGDMEM